MRGLMPVLMPYFILIVFIASLYVALQAYQNDRKRRNGIGRSVADYVGGAFFTGLVATILFWIVGLQICSWFLSPIATSNFFFLGLFYSPVSFAVGITAFVYWWRSNG